MSGDVHVQFCERPGVRLPRATHLERILILHVYGLPLELIARVTRRGWTLVAEYLNIIAERFPDIGAVKDHLRQKGVKI